MILFFAKCYKKLCKMASHVKQTINHVTPTRTSMTDPHLTSLTKRKNMKQIRYSTLESESEDVMRSDNIQYRGKVIRRKKIHGKMRSCWTSVPSYYPNFAPVIPPLRTPRILLRRRGRRLQGGCDVKFIPFPIIFPLFILLIFSLSSPPSAFCLF